MSQEEIAEELQHDELEPFISGPLEVPAVSTKNPHFHFLVSCILCVTVSVDRQRTEERATSRRDIVRHHSASRGAGTCPWDPTAARWS